ncbi:C-5 cytosine-specific DNA methylase [Vibrio nigripulchritudo ATCC 27043]|uniref:DNA cytosine methyltransferase n=1 Tax=Vibrio nigripulchritudo TaxID=28173 RepID=UPI00021C41B4|nr:DNA cytosine methyltransferase [Vibrio nigripulchritudo]EGU59513.1 C-5 cytosine-specific DNA methylase [Vibrio nigripulchritudo ATCC 27043]
MIKAVDLFCGAGGLTHGLEQAGIDVVAGYDIEESCRFAYEQNNESIFIQKDVALVSKEEIFEHFENAKYTLLAGCAPCQPFSRYNVGKDATKDKKWPLLYHFARLIKDTLPDFVTMENVPDVVRHSVYDDFVQELKELGYHVSAQKVFCPDYGMPQERKRHVLLASRIELIELIPATHKKCEYITVRDAISKLPRLQAGKQSKSDPLHRCASLSEINMKRMKASRQGGTWMDWPEELRAPCHRKSTGSTYKSVYARMSYDAPSPTMTTQCFGYGNGRFGHPTQNRAISLREAAIFQTFPPNYQFTPENETPSLSTLGRMIGNAVPVKLGEVIGVSILKGLV